MVQPPFWYLLVLQQKENSVLKGVGGRWELQACGYDDDISDGLTLWGAFYEVWGKDKMTAVRTCGYSFSN